MARKKAVVKVEVAEDSDLSPPPAGLLKEESVVNGAVDEDKSAGRKKRKRTTKVETKDEEVIEEDVKPIVKGKKRRKVEVKGIENVAAEEGDEGDVVEKKVKRKRKTKEEKEAEAMPLAVRTVGHKLYIGAHVSSAGGEQRSSQYRDPNVDISQACTTQSSTQSISEPTRSPCSSNHSANGPIHPWQPKPSPHSTATVNHIFTTRPST